jgi:hypothetical protein
MELDEADGSPVVGALKVELIEGKGRRPAGRRDA